MDATRMVQTQRQVDDLVARFEVRCPSCGAKQFMSRVAWQVTDIDHAEIYIRCWRRGTCHSRDIYLARVG